MSYTGNRGQLCPDANLLLVYLVGQMSAGLLASFKRTHSFGYSAFTAVRGLFDRSALLTTPAVLAEVTNLGPKDPAFREKVLHFVNAVGEQAPASTDVVMAPVFGQLGYADACLFRLSQRGATVLTSDYELAGRIRSARLSAIHLDELLAFES